ncbi:MAG: DUF4465 domain-containing protein [Planctomycetota bacterium]
MKLKLVLLTIATLLSLPLTHSEAAIVVDFDDLDTTGGDSDDYFDGHGAGATEGSWTTNGISFNTSQFLGGWSYSNVNDTTTPGFTNQWASITGTDASGAGNYVIGNAFNPSTAFFNFQSPSQLGSVLVSNATYAALSMEQGDSFAKQFGGPSGDDPDFFRVTFIGHGAADAMGDVTGTQEFFLADYRFADNSLDYIVDTWEQLDLSALGTVQSVSIAFDSSDTGAAGINTPTYVAIDNLSFTAVPEPGSLALVGFAGVGFFLRRRR